RFVRRRIHADVVLVDDAAVLVVRSEPDAGEIFKVVVDALNGIAVDQPLRGERRACWTEREDTETDGVVSEEVIPARRVVKQEEGADIRFARNAIAQGALDGRCPGARVADCRAQERHAREAQLSVGGKMKSPGE